ncbi:hypothetical protein [Candidatus Similichlamydia epinepheli]|uniref:hypothetical protein n=1 Tax=Candidatus Similichlamydia epinepheli TaxID=1903953 RepID=UPI000D3CE885|nr:hypothetical protein [Candidatus Similichlamydia epinepheli]
MSSYIDLLDLVMSRIGTFLFRDASPTFCFLLPSVMAAKVLPSTITVFSCFLSGFGASLNCLEGSLVCLKKKGPKEVFKKSRDVSHCVLWSCACLISCLGFELAMRGFWLLGIWTFLSSCVYLTEYYFCCTLSVDIRKDVRSLYSKARSFYLFLSILLIAIMYGKLGFS